MTDNVIGEAFSAVVVGVVTSTLFPAFTDVFRALDAPPMVLAVWMVIPIAGFIAGLIEASVFGFSYSLTLIFFGFYLNELGSIITGIIALGASIAGMFFRS